MHHDLQSIHTLPSAQPAYRDALSPALIRHDDDAIALDARDPLAPYRGLFCIPAGPDGCDSAYLCGNSLGLMPKAARAAVMQEMDDWARLGVLGHVQAQHPWTPYHERFTATLAELVGAKPIEVVAMNMLTVNLHQMLVSFYRPTAQRRKVVLEAGAFPSDRYAVASHVQWHGYDPLTEMVFLQPRAGERTLRTEDICEYLHAHGASVALVLLGHVNYLTGQAFDVGAITAAAHRHGCVMGVDLAHGIGNVPLSLHDWNVDFAVWCSYKYLNSGPGTVGGCFVHERYAHASVVDGQTQPLHRFAGWWGHDKESRFAMGPTFVPIPGAEGWQTSHPPILSTAPLGVSLAIFADVGLPALRAKSMQLTGFLAALLAEQLSDWCEVITPADPAERGAQLSIRIPDAGPDVVAYLISQGIVADFRAPDVLRVAPAPLYNRFTDVVRLVHALRQYAEKRSAVRQSA